VKEGSWKKIAMGKLFEYLYSINNIKSNKNKHTTKKPIKIFSPPPPDPCPSPALRPSSVERELASFLDV
jgi:hypothetical protein